jgi:hypothetical protein
MLLCNLQSCAVFSSNGYYARFNSYRQAQRPADRALGLLFSHGRFKVRGDFLQEAFGGEPGLLITDQ